MRIAFAADHAGAAFKAELMARLADLLPGEHELIDLGGDGSDPQDDYPDFAPRAGLGRSRMAARTAGSSSAGPASARRSPSTRCAASGPPVPRHLLRAPGRRARRHERADAGRPGDRHRAGGWSARSRSSARASPASRGTGAAWTRCWRSRRSRWAGCRAAAAERDGAGGWCLRFLIPGADDRPAGAAA